MALTASILSSGSGQYSTSADQLNAYATDFVTPGVVGALTNTANVAPMTGGYAINAAASANSTYTVSPGTAYIQVTPLGQLTQTIRVKSTSSVTNTVNPNTTGTVRYDWVYLSVDATAASNPANDGSNVASVYVSRSTSNTVDNGTPPSFGVPLAVVTIASNFSSIAAGNLTDKRVPASGGTSSPTTFTPAWTGFNVGNSNVNATYVQNGKLVTVSLAMQFGSTASGTNTDWSFVPPVPASQFYTTVALNFICGFGAANSVVLTSGQTVSVQLAPFFNGNPNLVHLGYFSTFGGSNLANFSSLGSTTATTYQAQLTYMAA